MTLSITTFNTMALSIMTLSIMTFNIRINKRDTQHNGRALLCSVPVPFMLSVFMLNVIMPSVAALNYMPKKF